MRLLSKGAEAELYLEGDKVIKKRIPKRYRLPELDEFIRKTRTRREAKLLRKASELGVKTPKVYKVDDRECVLTMEYVEGERLKEYLHRTSDWEIMRKVGECVAILHNGGIVHGDLTTSNIILSKEGVYFLDFGLGSVTDSLEDRAVDLVCFKKSFFATHASISAQGWSKFLEGYKKHEDAERVIARMEEVERRARYL